MDLPTNTPIVGMHFRPPAKWIVAQLPLGQALLLERDRENPYDLFAVKVLVDLSEMSDDFWENLQPHLDGAGFTKEELSSEPHFIAFVDSKKTGNAKLVAEALDAGMVATATYCPDMAGVACAAISWAEPEEEEEEEEELEENSSEASSEASSHD